MSSMSTVKTVLLFPVLVAVGSFLFYTRDVASQSFNTARDPGVRGGAPGAGGPITGLVGNQQAFFQTGLEDFEEAEEVDEGLGPRMNLDGCGGCHAQPAIGGSSPAVNPQVAFAAKSGGTDRVPSFIRRDGPIREARFVRNADGSPDGGVAALFTITGREGADGCRLAQPDFATQLSRRNVIFRIPTPLFGAGLIEQIEDSAILANLAANSTQKSQLGIRGRANVVVSGRTISGLPNRNGNDGTITRFGWKAQNVSLLLFSGEAYNVEMGITNELFQNEREQDPDCSFADVPNDVQNTEADTIFTGTTAIQNFANFQRFLAPPTPSSSPGRPPSRGAALSSTASAARTATRPRFAPARSSTITALKNRSANLFSDLLIHDMGDGLADGVSQGQAGPPRFPDRAALGTRSADLLPA